MPDHLNLNSCVQVSYQFLRQEGKQRLLNLPNQFGDMICLELERYIVSIVHGCMLDPL